MLTQKQMIAEMAQLTGQALKKYIKDIIANPIFISFSGIKQLPQLNNLKDKQQIDSLLKIFTNQTYQTYKTCSNKQIQLNNHQTEKLRQLSILTLFEGINTFTLSRLTTYLQLDSIATIQMLLAMNINKLIKVKIDQKNNIINIYFVKRRELVTTTNQEEANNIVTIEGRISKIIMANNCLENQIKTALQQQNKKKTKLSEKQRQIDIQRRFKFS